MRPAIMPISSFHSANSSGRPTTMDAMRAPCTGGLEYSARAMRLFWLSTRLAAPASAST